MKQQIAHKVKNSASEKTQGEIITLPSNEKIIVGPKAIPSTPAKASGKEILNMLKKAAKEGIFPPIPNIHTV